MKVKFYTLGCKVNQYDTQIIREGFLEKGFKEASQKKRADIYLINTCTVTSSADSKSREIIRRSIRENPKAKIIVTGCLAELDVGQIKGINKDILIFKNKEKENIAYFLTGKPDNRITGKPVNRPTGKLTNRITFFKGRTRAFLKIQDGCDNFCSYCKVSLVRGKPKSKPLKLIFKEAKGLVRRGFKEIVLTGICLGAYGRDFKKERVDLVDVIEGLEKIKGLERIRLSSIEAGDITDSLLKSFLRLTKLCPHLHIPIQSGDNVILKKMNRKYTRKSYLLLINKIKKIVPQIAITTDCIVGFPGESEKNFQNTLSLVQKINPLKVHIFPYSPREGTSAAVNYKITLPKAILNERVKRLKALSEKSRLKFLQKFKGKRLPVLFEALSKEKKGYWEGFTGNYIKVYLKSGKPLKNKIINIKLK
ncbi:MAG: tRNA (N(6)-L-threonylcarbamoyladenosine(37)-C(2))-methylthiotransferase MtaB [Candidatus Omnitrophota bacterium]